MSSAAPSQVSQVPDGRPQAKSSPTQLALVSDTDLVTSVHTTSAPTTPQQPAAETDSSPRGSTSGGKGWTAAHSGQQSVQVASHTNGQSIAGLSNKHMSVAASPIDQSSVAPAVSTMVGFHTTATSPGSYLGVAAVTTSQRRPSCDNALCALTSSETPATANPTYQSQTSGAQSSVEPTMADSGLAAVFTDSSGDTHTAVQSNDNIVIDSTATLLQGSTTSIAGISAISADSSGIHIGGGQGSDTRVAVFTHPASTVHAGQATTLITYVKSTYTVVPYLITASDTAAASHQYEAAVFTAGGSRYTAYQPEGTSPAVIAGRSTTLTLSGGTSTRLGDVTISVGASGIVAIDGAQPAYSAIGSPAPMPSMSVVSTAGDQTLTAHKGSAGGDTVGSMTVTSGSAITISNGAVISTGSLDLMLDGTSLPLGTQPPASAALFYTVADHTLTPGGIITAGGTTVSLAPSGDAYYVNGVLNTASSGLISVGNSVFSANAASPTASTGIGGYIMSGLQPAGPSTTVDAASTTADAIATVSSTILTTSNAGPTITNGQSKATNASSSPTSLNNSSAAPLASDARGHTSPQALLLLLAAAMSVFVWH